MHEYQVTLRNGTAYVYADTYLDLGGLYQFYKGDEVVKEFDSWRVLRVFKIW